MTDFREWMEAHRNGLDGRLCSEMVMKSGLKMSVQASEYHYCEPRKGMPAYVDYWEFEIGFPSEEIPEILQYAEQPDDPTETVYGYVPYELIQEIVDANGGIEE